MLVRWLLYLEAAAALAGTFAVLAVAVVTRRAYQSWRA